MNYALRQLCVIKEKHSKMDKINKNGHMNNVTMGSNVIEHLLVLPCAMNGLLQCD
jgi:hypothetical protein